MFEKVFTLKKFKNSYRLNNDSIISLSGPFGIGVAAADYYTNSSNLCGIYSIKMYVDEVLKYDLKFDELDFDNNHQINIPKILMLTKNIDIKYTNFLFIPIMSLNL